MRFVFFNTFFFSDDLFVSDLISRGASLEIEVKSKQEDDGDTFETLLHNCANSLQLKTSGTISSLVRSIMSTGRGFTDRKDVNGRFIVPCVIMI